MKKVLSLKFYGTVEYVNIDGTGAHVRIYACKEYDLINYVSIDLNHIVCADINYCNVYDSKMASVVRSLKKGDYVALTINKSKGFFGNKEEIKVENYTVEGYECLSEAEDLSTFISV